MVLALASSACSPPASPPETLLPATVAGSWTRTSVHATTPIAGALRAFEAVYEGSGSLTAAVHETKVSGVAFELQQHWKSEPNSVFFSKGRYFVLIKWQQADRRALTVFVRALEKSLPS